MARTYEDLSRRALISLNHSYDEDNKNKLQEYFDKKDAEVPYEDIRTIEKAVVAVDNASEVLKNSGSAMKAAASKAVDSMLDKVSDKITTFINSMGEEESENA